MLSRSEHCKENRINLVPWRDRNDFYLHISNAHLPHFKRQRKSCVAVKWTDVQQPKRSWHTIGLIVVQLSFISGAKIKRFALSSMYQQIRRSSLLSVSTFHNCSNGPKCRWYWCCVIEGETLEIDDVQMKSMSNEHQMKIFLSKNYPWNHRTAIEHSESNQILFDR